MVSKLVQVVHAVEDKYTPEGARKSIIYVPNDAPEWKKIRHIRGEMDREPKHINTSHPRTLKKYKYFDGKSSKPIIGTIKDLSNKLKVPETRLRNWATDRYKKRTGRGKPWVEKV